MKAFIKYIKTILPLFSFSKPKENKNQEIYFCIFGLEASSKSLLPLELQKVLTLGNAIPGYGVSYTPPKNDKEGIMYFGPKELIKAEAFDVFLD